MNRVQGTLPFLFTQKLTLRSNFGPEECVGILRAETSPMSDIDRTWGVKPMLAAFEPPRIVLHRFQLGLMAQDPIVYLRIDSDSQGSLIHCWAAYSPEVRISIAVRLLCGLFILGLLTWALALAVFIDAFVLIVFPLAGLIVISIMRWFVKATRKHYEESLSFSFDFIKQKLVACPTEASSIPSVAPGPKSVILEVAKALLILGAMYMALEGAFYAARYMQVSLPSQYSGLALPFVMVLFAIGGAIVGISRFRDLQKRSSAISEHPPIKNDESQPR